MRTSRRRVRPTEVQEGFFRREKTLRATFLRNHLDTPLALGLRDRQRAKPLAETTIGCCNLRMKKLSPSEKLLAALELQDLGLQMKRTQLARRNPDATPEEIDRLFQTWLRDRKPVPDGFRVVEWPRK